MRREIRMPHSGSTEIGFSDIDGQDGVSRRKKVAIFGGTFDPVHFAHIECAEQAKKALKLDKVIFMPASIPSFKRDKQICSFEDRLKMCELAIAEIEGFEVSDIEHKRSGVTYTIDTIERFREDELSNCELYFIIGSDAFLTLPEWKRADELAHLMSFCVIMRGPDTLEEVEGIAQKSGCRITVIDDMRCDISSSLIKEKLSANEPIDGLLPDSVIEYIKEKRLYEI